MKVALLTREFPPEVYGGAGVHVAELSRALAERAEVAVHCFGAPRADPLVAASYEPWDGLPAIGRPSGALGTLSVDLAMAAGVGGASLLHSHTWYANLAGHLGKLLWGVPHVATTHSLEPLRPWKAEQLGDGGYALSCFCERTGLEGADAVVAVSDAMREDVLSCYPALEAGRVRVIHNGVDPTRWRPALDRELLESHGIDPERPIALFLGRVTRQKGLVHLLRAAGHMTEDAQLVLLAGAADTPQLAAEVRGLVDDLSRRRSVVWIERMVSQAEAAAFYTSATVFVCPSVYEPFGLVNLEAMACGTAVVATAVGGIPEIVVQGETGLLVSTGRLGTDGEPTDPEQLARALAAALDAVVGDPARARLMGERGRERVLEHFSWSAVAEQTLVLYRELLGRTG